MGVIINDVSESTTGSITMSIPAGRSQNMLLAFTVVYQAWWYVYTSDPITRGSPSGGGGTWYPLDDEFTDHTGEFYRYGVRVYSWYSYPTQTGDVVLDTGSYTVDDEQFEHGRYSVFYSLSNAEYYDSDSFGETLSSSGEFFDNSLFGKQGGCAFGMLGFGSRTTIGMQPYGTSTISKSETLLDERDGADFNAYSRTVHDYHKGRRGVAPNYIRFSQPGIDNNAQSTGVGVFIAVDSVECSF